MFNSLMGSSKESDYRFTLTIYMWNEKIIQMCRKQNFNENCKRELIRWGEQ